MIEDSFFGLSAEGFHKVYYRLYGQEHLENTLMCVHGLTRNSADFHFLAQALEDKFRVVCPDVVGRGNSARFQQARHYSYHQYLSDMNVLMQRLRVPHIDWLGTSMGGLFGIVLASLPEAPIRRLILNDIGPFVPATAVDRLRTYAGIPMEFKDKHEADAFLRVAYAPFGPMSDEAWAYFMEHSLRPTASGTLTLDYDIRATAAVEGDSQDSLALGEDPQGNVTFWRFWDNIKCPVLLLHGKHSDLVPQHVIDEMRMRGPNFDMVQFEDTGHAPSLTQPDQIQAVKDWLDKTDAIVRTLTCQTS